MKKLTILLLILFCFSECKYEKGPLITFTTKENRVIGDWKIDEYFVNDENQLSNLDSLGIDYYNFHISDFGGSIGSNIHYVIIHGSNIPPVTSYWGFSENNENLRLTQSPYTTDSLWAFKGIPLLTSTEEQWTIIKLSNKKMWLRLNLNNNEYEIHLNKI